MTCPSRESSYAFKTKDACLERSQWDYAAVLPFQYSSANLPTEMFGHNQTVHHGGCSHTMSPCLGGNASKLLSFNLPVNSGS